MKRRLGVAVGVALAALVAWRVTHRPARAARGGGAGEPAAVPVETVRAARGTLEDLLQLTGDLHGELEAKVFAKVPGRLAKKARDVGETVRKGEVVCLVDRDEPAMRFALSEALSPLDGVVTRYFLNVGEALTPATPLCEVAALASVRVVVHVIERDLVRIRPGGAARFTVDGYPGQVRTGRIAKISESLDSATRSAEVEIVSDNPGGRLKPGMFARVELILDEHPRALIVPRRAVRETGETASLFVIKDGRAQFRPVRLGIIQRDRVEVLAGASEGDLVVTVGWQNLTDGMAVEVVSPAPRD